MKTRVAFLPLVTSPECLTATRPDLTIHEANSFRARLHGLAGRRVRPINSVALLLPRTASIHTFGMAFPLDLAWLSADGQLLRFDRAVQPRRLRSCRGAAAVVELAAVEVPVA